MVVDDCILDIALEKIKKIIGIDKFDNKRFSLTDIMKYQIVLLLKLL